MAADREVIREFLVALGFQIDVGGARKFTSMLMGTSKVAAQATAALAAVAVGAEIMVQRFASQMEKLYYASKNNKAAVQSLQAFDFSLGQIGLNGEIARSALEGMSRAIRMNPGITAFINSLGVKTEGRDRVEVLNEMIGVLSKMPHFVAANMMEQYFGIDEKTFLMMKEELPRMLEAQEKRKQMNRDAGIDAEKAASASRDYVNALRELWTRIDVLTDVLTIKMLPAFKEFMDYVNNVVQSVSKLGSTDMNLGQWHGQLRDIIEDLRQLGENLNTVVSSDAAKAFFWALGIAVNGLAHALLDLVGAVTSVLSGKWGQAGDKLKSMWNNLTNADTSPKGFNEAGAAAVAPNGGRGSIPAAAAAAGGGSRAILTSQFLGYSRSPQEIAASNVASIEGELRNMKKPEMRAVLNAELLTQQNLARGYVPPGSVAQVAGGSGGGNGSPMTQTNNITIHGAGDTAKTANVIEDAIGRANADLLRNGAQRVR